VRESSSEKRDILLRNEDGEITLNLKLLKVLAYGFVGYRMLSVELQPGGSAVLALVFLLLFVSVSQWRANYLFKRPLMFWINAFVEAGFCFYLFHRYGGFFSIYLFSVLMDMTSVFSDYRRYLPGLGAIGLFFSGYHLLFSPEERFSLSFEMGDLFLLLFFIGFMLFFQEEKNRKVVAQGLYDQLRKSEDRLKEAVLTLEQYSNTIEELTQLRERARISRELHDSVGHALSTLSLQLQAIQTVVEKDPPKAKSMLVELGQFTKNALENVRRAVRELRPIEFEAFEGIFAIEELVRNFSKLTGIDTRLLLSQNRYPMNSDQSHQLYQIVKESLSNSMRHGKARHITIALQFLENRIYSQIKDDGEGCAKVAFGMGLTGMQERAASLGGEMRVFSKPGKGFEIVVELPKRVSPPAQKAE
jgi:signal transduction histidine kinase